MRRFVLPLAALALGAAPVLASPALAQNTPSAGSIIQSLTPHGNLTAGGTRGIRLVAPPQGGATPAAMRQMPARGAGVAAPVPSVRPVAATSGGAASVNLNVDFATGSADLTPSARATLNQLGKALSSAQLGRYRFRIEGHTDTVGSATTNLTLSQQRAQAVAAYLEQTFGIQPSRLVAVGMGEQGLLVPTPPQTPNAANRRVEVINLGS
ncbi:MAG: OmpA family protein [Acetobacteraceae bacterium]